MLVTFYRALLRLYPRRVRDPHGAEMLRLFRDQRRELRREGRPSGPFVRRALADLIVNASAERLAPLRALARLRPFARRRFWMTAFFADLKYGVRLLIKSPGMTFIAVLTLAIGIGANAAIFSLLDAVLLRPLPYPDPDRIVTLWEKRPAEGVMDNVVSPADYRDWAARQTSFASIAAETETLVDLTGGSSPERVTAGVATAGFFDVFQTKPLYGRTFRPSDDVVGQHRVVLLTESLWRRRFSADPAIVGQPISLSGVPHDVIGVLPATFEFPGEPLEMWVPLPLEGNQPRASHFLKVYGRLKPGVTFDQGRVEIDRIGAQLSTEFPETNATHGAHAIPLREYLQGPVRAGLWILGGAVAFVMLIACVNVSNMLLARAAARRREMALRAAIGAGRARLAGQAITESLLLSAVGTIVGLGFAALAINALPALLSAQEPLFGVERAALSWRTVLFAVTACALTGLLFGALPAWQAASDDPNSSLKAGGRSPSGIRRRLRISLVGVEIALASLLLVGAGVALRSFAQVLAQPAGINTGNVLTFRISLPASRYQQPEQVRSTMTQIEDRLRQLPGAQVVSYATFLPLAGGDARRGITIEGREVREGDPPTRAHPRPVGPRYFQAIGATLQRGRGFNETDDERSERVAVINQTAAARYWPGRDPVGTRVMVNGTEQWLTVVGIVTDIRHWGLDRPVNPELYVPSLQGAERSAVFILRSAGDPTDLAQPARAAIREVDPNLPMSLVRTLDDVAALSAGTRRSTMVLLGAFALVALALAAAGVYGVMAHLVAMRTGEIAIRMTLGATPSAVLRSTVKEGLAVAAAGIGVGFAASLLLVEVLTTVAFGVQPLDPITYAGVAAALVIATVLACWVPARRAMRVDPAVAMRQA